MMKGLVTRRARPCAATRIVRDPAIVRPELVTLTNNPARPASEVKLVYFKSPRFTARDAARRASFQLRFLNSPRPGDGRRFLCESSAAK